MKDIVKKQSERLPSCKSIREFMFEEEVKTWSHGENKVLISIHEIKKDLYSVLVKVGITLDGLIINTSCKVDENVSVTIEDFCSTYKLYSDSLDSDVLQKNIADKTIHN